MTKPSRRFVVKTARLYRVRSRTPTGTAVILQTGRHLEKVETPEHRPVHRRYDRSLANHLGMATKRNADGVRSEKSGHKSSQPCESPPVTILDQYRDHAKLLDIAEGLGYLHANHITHGNLKGVGIFLEPFWASPTTLD